MSIGESLRDDAELRDKVDNWLIRGAKHLVAQYGTEITAIITETIERWDADEASRRIELHVGRDLQFIRINGTVVGSLAGLIIYSSRPAYSISVLILSATVLAIVSTRPTVYWYGAFDQKRPANKRGAMAQDADIAAVVSNAAQDIGSFIRAQREAAQVSVRELAEKAGVSNPYLSQIERGLRKPSADVLNQIAKALRVSAEVLYVRAGILEPGATSEVRDAIIADTAITERQKQVLLDIYTVILSAERGMTRRKSYRHCRIDRPAEQTTLTLTNPNDRHDSQIESIRKEQTPWPRTLSPPSKT